jgi:hypothetical protein
VRKFKAVPETLIGTGQTIDGTVPGGTAFEPPTAGAPVVHRPESEFSKLGNDAVKGANQMLDAIEAGNTDRNANDPTPLRPPSQF